MRRDVLFMVVIGVWFIRPRAACADASEVEALIAKGNELRREGKPWLALPNFQKAYELERTPRTAGQLGFAEADAGYPVEATDHLAIALESPDHPWVRRYRNELASTLAKMRTRTGEIAVEGTPAGASVVMNGKQVGALPLPAPVHVAAGRAEIVVRAEGYDTFSRKIDLKGGERAHVAVALDAKRAADAPASSPAAAPAPSPTAVPKPAASLAMSGGDPTPGPAREHPRAHLAAWITGGAAVAALATGVGLNLAARSKTDEFNHSCTFIGNSSVPQPRNGAMVDCPGLYDTRNTEKRWSTVAYIGGATLGVGSALLFWASYAAARPSSNDARAHLTCLPSPIGVTCAARF